MGKPATAEGQYVDYYDENSMFMVVVEAVRDSSYYIGVKRRNVSMRVYEGIPITLSVDNTVRTIEFVNSNIGDNVSIII